MSISTWVSSTTPPLVSTVSVGPCLLPLNSSKDRRIGGLQQSAAMYENGWQRAQSAYGVYSCAIMTRAGSLQWCPQQQQPLAYSCRGDWSMGNTSMMWLRRPVSSSLLAPPILIAGHRHLTACGLYELGATVIQCLAFDHASIDVCMAVKLGTLLLICSRPIKQPMLWLQLWQGGQYSQVLWGGGD